MSVPPLVGSSSGIGLKERIEMHVRDARVEEAVEALDESVDFDLQLIRARDGPVDGRVQRRRVAAGGENSDTFHRLHPERVWSLYSRSDLGTLTFTLGLLFAVVVTLTPAVLTCGAAGLFWLTRWVGYAGP